MRIEGLRKLTLLDYPGKVACTLFTHGCNFRCPFCHNAALVVRPGEGEISEEELRAFLEKRRGILDGVCITGGEPLLQNDIADYLRLIRSYGYLVKLDTNGSRPELLRSIIEQGLVDYVAMDIKSSPEGYAKVVGIPDFDITPICESVSILKNGAADYEFRTTVTAELHCDGDFHAIGKWLTGAKAYYLQQFVDSGDLIGENLHAASDEDMRRYLSVVRSYLPNAELRGM